MPITPGSKQRLNPVSAVGGAVVSTTEEIRAINQPLGKGSILYNSDTRELKITDGVTPPSALPDHQHPNTHAPLVHSHIYGANEPWLISNPKLWYLDDLVNHPELVALDGSEISDDKAEYISRVYPGTKLLTTEPRNLTANGFENDDLILSVSSFSGDFIGSRLFGDQITFESLLKNTDQWLSASSDVSQEQNATIAFKGGHTYRVTDYWVCPAAGTATELIKQRPTPKDWVLEGSNDNGTTWTTLDSHVNEPAANWEPLSTRQFTCTNMDSFAMLRLRITAWNAGAATDLQTGLRRFWVFGRKKDVFALPELASPHPDFVYVIPQRDLNVGLKHEDIGDIGITSVMPNLLGSYRLPTDGRSVSAATRNILFAVIGHQYDKKATIVSTVPSGGTILQGNWDGSGITDTLGAHVNFSIMEAKALGFYTIDSTGYRIPKSWIIEGDNAGTWEILQTITNATADGKFFLDLSSNEKAYTSFRITFLEWNDGAAPIGFAEFSLYVHTVGEFYLPTISTPGVTTYIVADNTVNDVSSEVIQRLQNNIIQLTDTVATLTNRVNQLDPSIVT